MSGDGSITVTGQATRDVTPDRARWTFDVTGAGEDEAGALQACVERTGAVLVALREEFGDDAIVSTGPTSLHEAYDDDPEYEEPPSARATVSATLPADLAGRAAPVAVRAGAGGAHGPIWEVADSEAVEEDLLVEAYAAARRKAERLAAASGRGLGEVREIREIHEFTMLPATGLLPPFETEDEPPMASPTPTLSASVCATFALVDVAG